MKILVCGSRHWSRRKPIWVALGAVRKKNTVTVIHGANKHWNAEKKLHTGADYLAGEIAYELGYHVVPFPADWEKFGKAAGPKRNQVMVDEKPDVVLAFTNDLNSSRGTADTVRRAKAAGIPVFIYPKTKNWYRRWKKIKS